MFNITQNCIIYKYYFINNFFFKCMCIVIWIQKDVEEDSLPIRRDRKTGKIRDRKEEKIEEDNKNKLLKEHKEKYFIWGKG